MIGKLDKDIIEKFKIFQEVSRKYSDLDIENIEFEYPTVENIFDIVRRGASPRPIENFIVEENDNTDKYNWLKIGDVTKSKIFLNETSQYINEKGKNKSVLGKKGDFLITNSMTVGIPIILDIETCFHDGFLYLGFNDREQCNYYNLYLFHFFTSYRQELISKSKDGIVKNLNTDIIKEVKIPIPRNFNKNYSSFTIQKVIVEFLEFWKIKYSDVFRNKIAHIQPIFHIMKKNLISSTFKKDKKIVESFNEFVKYKGINLKFEDVKSEKKSFGDISKFYTGNSEYKKPYYTNQENLGTYNLMTGSLAPVAKIKPLNESDIIKAPRLSFNKDNDAGSTCFYHEEDFIVGGHHYWIKINEELENELELKYVYFIMKKMFDENMFYQSKDPKANSGTIAKQDFFIVKHDNFTSLKLQKLLVEFWEIILNNIDLKEEQFKRTLYLCDKLDETFLYKTFSNINWSK